MPSHPSLTRGAIRRIVLDLLAAELARSRGRSAAVLGRRGWNEATRVDEAGLDLDSLERLDVAAALTEFFHLHEYGAEDYLLALPSIGEWCDLIAQSLAATGMWLTFRTSGSTGEPKRCTHALADLRAEAAMWATRFADAPAIVAPVPSHHIYGTIFTALVPDALGCAVTDVAGVEAVRDAAPATLVIGTPTHWAYLARSLLVFPGGVTGVTSTATMPTQLAHRLRGQRLTRLVEVYGSSETAGIASREHEGAAFTLLPGWSASGEGLERALASGERSVVTPPDHLQWLDERRFAIRGRRDGAVQVGGINVFPARVRDTLLAHAGVADAAVRLEADTGRLKAFVVPARADDDRLLGDLDRWCGDRLAAAERPRRFALGGTLPVNAMGKPADW